MCQHARTRAPNPSIQAHPTSLDAQNSEYVINGLGHTSDVQSVYIYIISDIPV